MEAYRVEEVNKTNLRGFYDCCFSIYRHFPTWVAPLETMIEDVFNPQKNELFNEGEAARWILFDGHNEPVGRIAAFYHPKKYRDETTKEKIGAIGFFECLENDDAANMLFKVAEKWIKQKGIHAYIGPVNFGETDVFWGLLTDGYDRAPSFGMNYHPKYYKDFFEKFGFEVKYKQYSNIIWLRDSLPGRFKKIADWAIKRNQVTLDAFSFKNIDKYTKDFVEIYNDAWVDFQNFTPYTIEKAKADFVKFKSIAQEGLSWFAYVDGEPASFLLAVMDANELIHDFKGKLNWINKIKFLIRKKTKPRRFRIIVMGTKNKFRNMGLESAIYKTLEDSMDTKRLKHYELCELSWVGDFNDNMRSIHKATKSHEVKEHCTYQKIIATRCAFRKK